MFKHVSYIMVTVSNMTRSVEFYRDMLGIPLKFQSPDWAEFNTGTTTLALHGGGKPREGAPTSKEMAGSCSFGFNVENIDDTFKKLTSKGVKFVMPPMDRPNEGIKLAAFLDPDGMGITIAESKKH